MIQPRQAPGAVPPGASAANGPSKEGWQALKVDPVKGQVDINVDISGQVFLRGVAVSEEAAREIIEAARSVPGVTGVFSQIDVIPRRAPIDTETPPPPPVPAGPNAGPSGPECTSAGADRRNRAAAGFRRAGSAGAGRARRAALSRRILGSLGRRPQVAELPVKVRSDDGVVTLSGQVPSTYEAMIVYRAAQQTPGVHEIVDRLEFTVPDEDHINPLLQKGRPDDIEPYLASQIRRHVGDLAHIDRVTARGDLLELRGTIENAADLGAIAGDFAVDPRAPRVPARDEIQSRVVESSASNCLDLPPQTLIFLGEVSLSGFRRLGTLALFVGTQALFVGAPCGSLAPFDRRQETLTRGRIEKAKVLAVALQVETQNLARQPAGNRLDGNIVPALQPKTLKRRIEILRPRVEHEVLRHLQNVSTEHELLLLVLAPGGLGRDLEHKIGGLPFFPNQVAIPRGLLGDTPGYEHVGRDVLPAVAFHIIEEHVGTDIHGRLTGKMIVEQLEGAQELPHVKSGLRHGLSISGWILDFARSPLLGDRRHDRAPYPVKRQVGLSEQGTQPLTRRRVDDLIVALPEGQKQARPPFTMETRTVPLARRRLRETANVSCRVSNWLAASLQPRTSKHSLSSAWLFRETLAE